MTRSQGNRPARAAALAAVVVGIAAGGCGGDEKDPGTVGADASKQEYVDGVRAAVGPVAPESQQLSSKVRRARSLGDLSQPLDEAEEGYRTAMRELEAVTPPAEVAELHEQLVDAQRQIADATEEAERAAERNDPDALDEFSEAGDRYARRSRALSESFAERGYEF